MGWQASTWASPGGGTGGGTGGGGGGTDYDASAIAISGYANSWSAYGGDTPTYQKSITGSVHLSGTFVVGSTVVGALLAQLPADRAPAGNTNFTLSVTGGTGSLVIRVDSAGSLSVVSKSGTPTRATFTGASSYTAA